MIVVTEGIVLSRRRLGESDRLVSLYTKEFGRALVRFVGVLKSRAKLRALSEPLTRAEFRLYLKPPGEYGKCIGGEIATVHPRLRSDLGRTFEALHLAELMDRLTPLLQPSAEKFDLLSGALETLEGSRGGEWFSLAYTLRLLELAGLGVPAPSPEDEPLWARLHRDPLSDGGAGWAPQTTSRLSRHMNRYLELSLERPLQTQTFRRPQVVAHG